MENNQNRSDLEKRDERRYGLADPFFEDFFGFPFDEERKSHAMMKTDIKENENTYDFKVEVPGLNKDQIHLSLDNGYLTISASEAKNSDVKDNNGKFIRKERFTGSYERSFYVGNINQKDITAKLENGILSVSFPKESKAEENKKLIEIK
jgi:HSP20 family protein